MRDNQRGMRGDSGKRELAEPSAENRHSHWIQICVGTDWVIQLVPTVSLLDANAGRAGELPIQPHGSHTETPPAAGHLGIVLDVTHRKASIAGTTLVVTFDEEDAILFALLQLLLENAPEPTLYLDIVRRWADLGGRPNPDPQTLANNRSKLKTKYLHPLGIDLESKRKKSLRLVPLTDAARQSSLVRQERARRRGNQRTKR